MKRSPIARRTPLLSRAMLARKVTGKRVVRSTGPSRAVVDLVYERAQYFCELDTASVGPLRGVDHHIHHRRPRRAGGSRAADTNSPSNLMLLCPPCHEVIEIQRADAYAGGWLLHAGQDPAQVPVLIGAVCWLYLTADGRYSDYVPSDVPGVR